MNEKDSEEMEKSRRDAAEALMMSAIGGLARPTSSTGAGITPTKKSPIKSISKTGEATPGGGGDTTESENDDDNEPSPSKGSISGLPKVVDVPAKQAAAAVSMDPVMAATMSNFGGKPPRPKKGTPIRRQVRKQLPTAAKRQLQREESAMSTQEAIMLGLISEDDPDAKRAKLGTGEAAIAEMDPVDYLNKSVRLEYDWKELKLGEDVGTAALNRYLKSKHSDPKRAPELTAQQTLQIAMSLRPRTILPPKGSVLHRVVRKAPELGFFDTPVPELQQESEDAAAFLRTTFRSLSHTYQFLCEQDIDDGEMFRSQADYVRDAALLEHLRSLENEVSDSKTREDAILQRADALGLVDPKRVAGIMAGQPGVDVEPEKEPEPVPEPVFSLPPETPSSDQKLAVV